MASAGWVRKEKELSLNTYEVKKDITGRGNSLFLSPELVQGLIRYDLKMLK